MVIHKWIVFRVNDERWLSDIAEPRHGAALPVIIQRIGETMDFGGDRNSGSSDHSWCSGDEEAEDEEAVSGNGVQR